MAAINFDSEKAFEDAFVGAMKNGKCLVSGEDTTGHTVTRQVNLGGWGVADIIRCNEETLPDGSKEFHFTIYELKNEKFNIKHIAQAARYRDAVMVTAEALEFKYSVHCFVLAPESSRGYGRDCYLIKASEDWLTVADFNIDLIDGIKFSKRLHFRPREMKGKTIADSILAMMAPHSANEIMESFFEGREAMKEAEDKEREASQTKPA